MSDDIIEFLRRAAERRNKPLQPEIEILDADLVEDAEILEDERGLGKLSEHHLDTASFETSQLGSSIDRADDRMESHLSDVFEHKLGDLGTQTARTQESTLDDDDSQPDQTAARAPQDFAAMLRRPQDLRNAIILSEIIRRPEELS